MCFLINYISFLVLINEEFTKNLWQLTMSLTVLILPINRNISQNGKRHWGLRYIAKHLEQGR